MKNFTDFFLGRETTKLFYQYWLPDSGEVKANLMALHGLGGHSDRMETPAEELTKYGYAVFTFDIRGHWRNIKNIPGHFKAMDLIQKDIVLFMDVINDKVKNVKTFITGQSLGGLIALKYAINRPGLPGVIVSSPLLDFNIQTTTGKTFGRFLTSRIAPTKVLDMKIEQNKLTTDLKLLRKFIADKHKLQQITYNSYSEIMDSIDWVMKNASKMLCPILIQQAGDDKIGNEKQTKKFFKKIRSKDKTYRGYDGYLHDLWHEKGRALVYRDMYIWLEKHL